MCSGHSHSPRHWRSHLYLKHKLDLGDKIIFAVTKWPGIANHCSDQVLWLCSVVRSVFVQSIANYPLLIAENSDKISERSLLWNSDQFFANNNRLIGADFQLPRNGRKIIPVWQSQENIYSFSHHHRNILIPQIPSIRVLPVAGFW